MSMWQLDMLIELYGNANVYELIKLLRRFA
jgi:hypothetical protein